MCVYCKQVAHVNMTVIWMNIYSHNGPEIIFIFRQINIHVHHRTCTKCPWKPRTPSSCAYQQWIYRIQALLTAVYSGPITYSWSIGNQQVLESVLWYTVCTYCEATKPWWLVLNSGSHRQPWFYLWDTKNQNLGKNIYSGEMLVGLRGKWEGRDGLKSTVFMHEIVKDPRTEKRINYPLSMK